MCMHVLAIWVTKIALLTFFTPFSITLYKRSGLNYGTWVTSNPRHLYCLAFCGSCLCFVLIICCLSNKAVNRFSEQIRQPLFFQARRFLSFLWRQGIGGKEAVTFRIWLSGISLWWKSRFYATIATVLFVSCSEPPLWIWTDGCWSNGDRGRKVDNGPSTACVCGEHRSANQVIPAAKTLAGINLWKEIGYNLPLPCIVFNVSFWKLHWGSLSPSQVSDHLSIKVVPHSNWKKGPSLKNAPEVEGTKQARLDVDEYCYRSIRMSKKKNVQSSALQSPL